MARSVSEPAAAHAAARADAFADAAAKAGQLGELAGRRLGAILSIDEVSGGGPRLATRSGSRAGGWVAQSAAVPVEAGSQRIETTLVVRWTLLG